MILYFPNDILNCFTGEILYPKGTQLTDQIVLTLMRYGIDRYEVCIHKPAEDREPPKTETVEYHPTPSTDNWELLDDGLDLETLERFFYYP